MRSGGHWLDVLGFASSAQPTALVIIRKLRIEQVVAFLLLSCMLITGCMFNSATDNIRLQSTELRSALAEELKSRGIWHADIGQDSIRFKKTDKEAVVKALEDISNAFLPIGRSASYAPNLQKIFKERLNKAGIRYRTQVHDGVEWIIWSEVDKKTVHEIETGIQQLITGEKISRSMGSVRGWVTRAALHPFYPATFMTKAAA